jgi:hypothetical protein
VTQDVGPQRGETHVHGRHGEAVDRPGGGLVVTGLQGRRGRRSEKESRDHQEQQEIEYRQGAVDALKVSEDPVMIGDGKDAVAERFSARQGAPPLVTSRSVIKPARACTPLADMIRAASGGFAGRPPPATGSRAFAVYCRS